MQRDDPRRLRQQKLAQLVALGLPYFPSRYGATRPSTEVQCAYEILQGTRVRVAGRLMTVRLMGKAGFAHIQDGSGQIQLYFKRDVLGDGAFEYFKLLDIGDIVGAEGSVFRTRTGEVSIQVQEIVLLAKAYRQLPDKWHGLTDVEARYRQRYLDLISNPDTRRIFRTRSEVVRAMRQYLGDRGFIEVETPALQPLYGGAAANPFTTRYSALDIDAYLRIATELYLKRLIVGGFERVFEIGKDFRNEGFSRKHSPEFTMLELYQAYADYQDIMALTEDLFAVATQAAVNGARVIYQGQEIDLTPPWQRFTIFESLKTFAGVEITSESSREDLQAIARKHNVAAGQNASRGKLVEELVSALVEPKLIQPAFLYDFPIDFPGSLLAKRKASEPDTVERFEMYMAGMEIANAFTELNDAEDQHQRMLEAVKLTGEERQEVDTDFIRALEYGMPPTGGIGFGIDRLVMVLTDAHHIRETILFPLLKPREDPHAES